MASKGRKRTQGPRGGAGGLGGGNMMKQIEQLQQQMAEAQAALEEETVTVSAGGGAVTVVMTGAQELRELTIKPEVVDPEDVEMLQDLIMAAISEARTKSQQMASDRMAPLTGGLDVPGLF